MDTDHFVPDKVLAIKLKKTEIKASTGAVTGTSYVHKFNNSKMIFRLKSHSGKLFVHNLSKLHL